MTRDELKLKQYFRSAIDEAARPSDKLFFILTLGLFLAILIVVSVITSPLVFWVTGFVILVSLIIVRIEQIWILNNAIEIDGSDYTYLDDIIREISDNLGVIDVHIFTIRDTKEAFFTIGHLRHFSIVFDAEFMEVMTDEEARAIMAREIAQIKYGSAGLNSFIKPLSEKLKIVGLGAFIGWLFGFWARRAEETANRLALLYVRDPHILIKALVVSKMGKRFAELLAEDGLLSQKKQENSLISRIAETFSYEAFLTTQVKEILEYAEEQNIPIPEQAKELLHGKS